MTSTEPVRRPVVAIVHWIAAVLLIGGLSWGLHPVIGIIGVITVTAIVAEIHGYMTPVWRWIASFARSDEDARG